MPIPTDADGTWFNPGSYQLDAGKLRRADGAIFAGDGSTTTGARGGIVRHSDNSLLVSVDGADVVTVQPGAVVVPGNAVSGTGPYRLATSAAITGSLAARNATNPRITLVVFRALDDDVVTTHDAYKGQIAFVDGTPASVPAVPTLPSMAVELARITVPATGGGAATANLSFRTFAASLGAELPVPTFSQLPTSAAKWQPARALDTGTGYRFNGTSWVTNAGWQDLTALGLTAAAGWTIDSARAFVTADGVVRPDIRVTRTGATITPTSGGNITPDVAIATAWPTALRPTPTWYLDFNRNSLGSGKWRLDSTGAATLTDFYPGSSVPNGESFTLLGDFPLG